MLLVSPTAFPETTLVGSNPSSLSTLSTEPKWPNVMTAIGGGFAIPRVTAAAIILSATNAMLPTATLTDFSVIGESLLPRVAPSQLAAHFMTAAEEMTNYARLTDGWDGDESIAPKMSTVGMALAFLRSLPAYVNAPEATVASDGTVGWYWKTSDVSASVSFLPNQKVAYYAKSKARDLVAKGTSITDGRLIPNDLLEVLRLA